MATILWAYLRNPAFKTPSNDYHLSADLTGQANHLAATLEADIVKQKLPENNGGASGKDDLHQAVRTAVINKRAGGMGMIAGRKAFQRRFKKGVPGGLAPPEPSGGRQHQIRIGKAFHAFFTPFYAFPGIHPALNFPP